MARVHAPLAPGGAPGTITDYVTDVIRDRIVLGVLAPGAKVPVYELAKELDVSRVPLREAVRQLEAESLVDNLPRRGSVVRPLSEADLRDSFELLRRIEPIAARRAALSEDPAVADELEKLLAEVDALSAREMSDADPEMLHAHRDFHFALFRSAGEGVLQHHLCMLWNTCERYVMRSLPDTERQEQAAQEHAELVRLIRAGDPDETERVLERHLQASLTSALRHLDVQPDGAGTG